MNLTTEELRLLAEVDRKMDSGEQPFVMTTTGRMAVLPSVMDELGLKCGQTVCHALVLGILQASLAYCNAQIALKRASVVEANKS